MQRKRKFALAVIIAMIISMLPTTVFAADTKAAGSYDAAFVNFSQYQKQADDTKRADSGSKIGMYCAITDAKLNVDSVGSASAVLSAESIAGGKFLGVYVGDSTDNKVRNKDMIPVENGKITIPNVTPGKTFSLSAKYISKSNMPSGKESWGSPYTVYIAEKIPSSGLNVSILRNKNFESAYVGTDFGKAKYSIKSINSNFVTLTIKGNTFTKSFLGSYDDLNAALEEKDQPKIANFTPVNGEFDITLAVTELGKPVEFCLYQTSMGGKWRGYTATFTKGEEKTGEATKVWFEPKTVTIDLTAKYSNDTIDLNDYVKTEPANAKVTWTLKSGAKFCSFDPSTGYLTGKESGTVKVQASSGKKKATITVKIKTPVKVKKLNVNKKTATIDLNNTKKLTIPLKYTFTPSKASNKKFTLTNSNAEAVEIVDFNVEKGTATIKAKKITDTPVIITATSDDNKSATATTKVTVKDSGKLVDLVYKNAVTIKAGKTKTIKATTKPSKARCKSTITYRSGDETKATVDSKGKVTVNANATGTVVIYASVYDADYNNPIEKPCVVTIK